MAAELAGRSLACVHAFWALRLNESKNRSAKRNSVDQIQRPRRTGGIVSGPGRTARAKPRAMQSIPTTKTPTRIRLADARLGTHAVTPPALRDFGRLPEAVIRH